MRNLFGISVLVLAMGFSARAGSGDSKTDSEADQYFPLLGQYAASHILITYKGATRAEVDLKRSKKEAKAKASELLARIKADPSLFEKIAEEESDGPSAPLGGHMGAFLGQTMDPAFIAGLRKLKIGEISSSPVKTQFGYHIIRRDPMSAKFFSAQAIIFTHKDATRITGINSSSPGFYRTIEQARETAEALMAQLTPENFDTFLPQSDFLVKGGRLGNFKAGDLSFGDEMIEALSKVGYGEITPLVESEVGFAYLKRHKVQMLAAAEIWISYIGAESPPYKVLRTKEEARKVALDLAAKVTADPESFSKFAKEFSDGPFALRGGVLQNWFVGARAKQFEEAILALEIGEVTTTPVDAETGFFLFKRLPLEHSANQ